MSELIDIRVPDIGEDEAVPVIEVFVKVGDRIAVDDSIVTLESDKATMDIPATAAGVVREVLVKVGDSAATGTLLVRLEASADAGADSAADAAPTAAPQTPAAAADTATAAPAAVGGATTLIDIAVPDIGDEDAVPVIELFVKVGDRIAVDDPVATLESDKATMDIPASAAGTVSEVLVKVGDKVSTGSVLLKVSAEAGAAAAAPAPAAAAAGERAPRNDDEPTPLPDGAPTLSAPSTVPLSAPPPALPRGSQLHASPSVRAFARQLGVDLAAVKATGPRGRILREDVTAFVKAAMSSGTVPGKAGAAGGTALGGGLDLLPWPKVDFARFGEIDVQPLSRIKKISGQNLARNWVMVPAVTYHEDADITALEAFRVQINKENEKNGRKLTLLAFLIKACVRALQEFPEFNTSLDGDNLVYKKYFNIAFAADTPNGLVVPVIKEADRKSVFDIAAETAELAKKARDGKLSPADMSGACFTISSLGGIGGTYFSPIVNAPEVAILGVNKSAMKPVWNGKKFSPRLVLPMSLSADHRVIDGALATRFNVYLAQLLADFRRVML